MIFNFLKNTIDLNSICVVCLILVCGIVFIHLQKHNYLHIEHFPASLRYTEKLHQQPKLLLPKIAAEMHKNTTNYSALPDDYQYLYDYEKNFDKTMIHGNFPNRLSAYEGFLMKNKNTFHNLDDRDIDNLAKLLNNGSLSNQDIPDNFIYKKDFIAINN